MEKEEYNYNGILIYEGEFLNGIRSGKGKEYDHGDLIFEGEYLNGIRNGKGKDYDSYNGKLLFEGNYLDGFKNGKGKQYDFGGELKFEGEFLNNIIIKGKRYVANRVEFEGEFKSENKKWNGKGYDENSNVIYELINGNGKVKEYYRGGKLKFEGEFLKGIRNGKGRI